MKKVIVAAMVLVLIITGASFAFQNEPDGFRDLKWEDPLSEDMKLLVDLEDRTKTALC